MFICGMVELLHELFTDGITVYFHPTIDGKVQVILQKDVRKFYNLVDMDCPEDLICIVLKEIKSKFND